MADIEHMKQVGERISTERKRLNLTQEALAEKADVSPQLISCAELGKRALRSENLMRIAHALNVSADYLCTGEFVDVDSLRFTKKLQALTPSQIKIIETLLDEFSNK